MGHIPTAWYPYRVAVSSDGRQLASVSFKGFGNGPNAGRNSAKDDFRGLRGAITITDAPSDQALKDMSQHVLEYNGIVDAAANRAAS